MRESSEIARWFGRSIICDYKSVVLKLMFILTNTRTLNISFKKNNKKTFHAALFGSH